MNVLDISEDLACFVQALPKIRNGTEVYSPPLQRLITACANHIVSITTRYQTERNEIDEWFQETYQLGPELVKQDWYSFFYEKIFLPFLGKLRRFIGEIAYQHPNNILEVSLNGNLIIVNVTYFFNEVDLLRNVDQQSEHERINQQALIEIARHKSPVSPFFLEDYNPVLFSVQEKPKPVFFDPHLKEDEEDDHGWSENMASIKKLLGQ